MGLFGKKRIERSASTQRQDDQVRQRRTSDSSLVECRRIQPETEQDSPREHHQSFGQACAKEIGSLRKHRASDRQRRTSASPDARDDRR